MTESATPQAPATPTEPTVKVLTDVDRDAFVRDNISNVYRLAYRLTGNKADAEDLTQDAFVRAFRAMPNFKPGNVGGWLHRITTNLFLDRMRRKKRIRFDAFTEGFADKLRSSGHEPEEALEYRGLDDELTGALMRLSPAIRAAVVLCDLEGLSYEETAQSLDIPSGTVRSRIHRGRSQLRKQLEHRRPTRGGVVASPVTR